MKLKEFPSRDRFDALARTCNVIPVCREILADMETPVSLLKKCYDDGGKGPRTPLFLLESVEGGEKWGRYSFLGTSARTHVKVFADQVIIAENGQEEKILHGGDPLSTLKTFMSRFQPAEMGELPRFWGGLVGYLTYEMVSFFERIPNRMSVDTPMAHFILCDELLIFDNIRNTMICVAIAFTDGNPDATAAYDDAMTRLDAIEQRMATRVGDAAPEGLGDSPTMVPLLAAQTFRERVASVKDHIQQGDVIQAVISQPFQCSAPGDIIAIYRAQRYVNPSPYLYFFHFDEMVLVGSSPETMVRLENGVATLRPIAGTRPRGSSEQADRALASELLADEKERAEHLMLVDLGRNDLGRIARTGTVQVTDLMVVERYSHVMHLVSNINCDIEDGYDAWDLLRASFPAGTLSGAPKVRAMEIIDELEQSPRGPYGGAVGYVSFSGNMDLAITIRTACIENGTLTVRAGAGIVADSDPESERLETVNKAMAIQRALELTCQGVETTP
ncbi:anthranilate synthase component I family protein [Desulfosarcina sp.]|uniref:anthranilate synthase component I family protein n=1 Tax=Desulfosarcina sp. TaxID=2027861 RepID=UPI0029AB7755|nr:anthranilate synthase component I family protein [Desulfosarcina sp.]MDX2452389.1 anthranilate synthase component I family protein [Desulfosarcina sp.]MDX2490169.1 anthranilate synthase component I family protein [Desulfosarcina sp.]